MVGGELTAEMLDLQYQPDQQVCHWPMGTKSPTTVFSSSTTWEGSASAPTNLLNRWVVPLDRRIEFLTSAGGRKIEILFEMLAVFASNSIR